MPYLDGDAEDVDYHDNDFFEITTSGEYNCKDTHGYIGDHIKCDNCYEHAHDEYEVRTNYGYSTWCEHCVDNHGERIDGDWYDREMCVYSEYHDEYILEENAYYSERVDSWVYQSDAEDEPERFDNDYEEDLDEE